MRLLNVLLILIALLFSSSAWAFPNNTESVCPDPYFVCPYFGNFLGLSCTFEGSACEGKDCEGRYEGEGISVVATGRDYRKWVGKYEGAVSLEGYIQPCDLTMHSGVTFIGIPESFTACAFTLITDTGLYMEHFASNPGSPCYGFVECPCESPVGGEQ